MIGPLNRLIVQSLKRFNGPALILCALFLPAVAGGQFSPPVVNSARSVSGQFVVTAPAQFSLLAHAPDVVTNAGLVRLEPALLSVSAERIKASLRRELGIKPDAPWRGNIFLTVHPAQSLDEEVTIVSQSSASGWNYQVQLPDVLSQTRFVRALTGVLLLESANRDPALRDSAEIPAWLTDGLSQQLLAEGAPEIILSAPGKFVDGLPQSRIVATRRGVDPLAGARRVLRDQAALTFEQLSWPTDVQLAGEDGGAYRASAQLFVSELLGLKNGPARLRAMLAALPGCYNWQTAFRAAFQENFSQPLDVEKWWALQVVSFASHDPGPRWTPAVSRQRLDEILSVPVEIWIASNTLPAHAEVSLQAVIRNFEPPRRTAMLQTKLRDLQLAQLRMAAPLAVLTDDYRRALADFLGEHNEPASPLHFGKHPPAKPKTGDVRSALKKLDALDVRRRAVESAIKPDVWAP